MFLSEFTWWQFAIVATLLTVAWYTGVLLLFFREEIKEALGLKPKPTEPPKSAPIADNEKSDDVMGATKEPEGVIETYDIGFAPSSRENQLGLVPDFLKEFTEIMEIVKTENGTVEDFMGMLEELGHAYPSITTVENWDSLVVHIKDNSPFPLTEEEIKSLFR